MIDEFCANPRCFGHRAFGSNLCGKCKDVRDSAIIVGLCLGLCVLIFAFAKIGSLL